MYISQNRYASDQNKNNIFPIFNDLKKKRIEFDNKLHCYI